MTTGFYRKVAGVWTPAARPYVKADGQWKGVNYAYIKAGGVWTEFWDYDISPSSPPAIQLYRVGQGNVVDSNSDDHLPGDHTEPYSNYVKVAITLPDLTHDTDLKMIRVLTNYAGTAPTSQYGGTYTTTPESYYPAEPWSDFYYNGWKPDGTRSTQPAVRRTTTPVIKTWPPNAVHGTQLPAGTYYFTAWSLDNDGNWSAPTNTGIILPQYGSLAYNQVTRAQFFYPLETGTYNIGAGTFTDGAMTQSATGPTQGAVFYGTQVQDAVFYNPYYGTVQQTIDSAQILLYRSVDSGDAAANVYAGVTNNYANGAALNALSAGSTPSVSEIHLLGTIAKGEAKWFTLPESWVGLYEDGLKSIHFWHKNPAVADPTSADYSSLLSRDNQIRCGQLALVWTNY